MNPPVAIVEHTLRALVKTAGIQTFATALLQAFEHGEVLTDAGYSFNTAQLNVLGGALDTFVSAAKSIDIMTDAHRPAGGEPQAIAEEH